MENSISSNNNSTESSTWIMYIDQFTVCSEGKAVSSRNPNPATNYTMDHASYNLLKDLRFKKRRRREIPFDDSLEDTATSPVNLSKAKDLYHLNAPTKKKKDSELIFQRKTNVTTQESKKRVMDETREKSFTDEMKYDCSALRKRGLCLVPLSMLIDYLG